MKKIILVLILGLTGTNLSNAQKLKNRLNEVTKGGEKTEKSSNDGGLPKGIEVYNTEHSDPTGMSGKYYTLYPVYLEANRKGFYLNEVTVEYRNDQYNGVFHWINDEVAKGFRYPDADMSKVADFYGTTGVAQINRKLIDKYNNYAFRIKTEGRFLKGTNTKKQTFKDGAEFIRYSQDPDIIIVSSARIFDSQGCIPINKKGDTYDALKIDTRYEFDQHFNLLSKDPNKLKDIDSTKLVNMALEASVRVCSDVVSVQTEDRGLPKQGKNDDTLEKELFQLIKPMASNDKPTPWGDNFEYVYLHTDWKVYYKDIAKTVIDYRVCSAIATSCGWPVGECRYIAVHVKQYHNGTEYGQKELRFGGSLIPVSQEKVKNFSHK